jgi:hypothetical protein
MLNFNGTNKDIILYLFRLMLPRAILSPNMNCRLIEFQNTAQREELKSVGNVNMRRPFNI